jgi:hypothetical protein
MDSLEQDLNTLRIYGRGLSQYDLEDSFEDDIEEDDDEDTDDDEVVDVEADNPPDEQSSEITNRDLDSLDMYGLATRIVKLLKLELTYERERSQ